MELGLKDRTAVVCASSSGIGFAAARRFADEGAQVVLVARTPARLNEAAAVIEARCGHRPRIHAADLTTPAGRESVVAAIPAPDILVASPGIPQRPVRYQQLDASAWAEWFQAHFHSAIDLIHAYAPGMCERGFGRIVNISANFIKFPQVGVGQSHAARLALAGAIASLVREVAPYNVTINSVLPGLVEECADRPGRKQRRVLRRGREGSPAALRGRSHRQAGRTGRSHRDAVRCANGLSDRPEHRQRRRRLPGAVLSLTGPGRPAYGRSIVQPAVRPPSTVSA